MDNFTFAVNPAKTVRIDVEPGANFNVIDLDSPVPTLLHIFSAEDFNAADIDPNTIRLAGAGVFTRWDGTQAVAVRDVNRDGRPDLIVQIVTRDMRLGSCFQEAVLEASTCEGAPITASDTVWVQP